MLEKRAKTLAAKKAAANDKADREAANGKSKFCNWQPMVMYRILCRFSVKFDMGDSERLVNIEITLAMIKSQLELVLLMCCVSVTLVY